MSQPGPVTAPRSGGRAQLRREQCRKAALGEPSLSSYGHGNGISLRIRDEDRLRRQLVMVLLEHLADPSGEDQGVLTEAIFGPDASDDPEELIGAALRDVLHERDEA